MNYINPVIQPDVTRLPEWIVRRLLPMECGRLQGFPDGWGEIAPLANETEIRVLAGSVPEKLQDQRAEAKESQLPGQMEPEAMPQ